MEQPSKTFIKLELNHFNHIPNYSSPAKNVNHLRLPENPNLPIKMERLKQENIQIEEGKNAISYLPNDSQEEDDKANKKQGSNPMQTEGQQTKNQQDNSESLEQTYREIISTVIWQCPCGKKIYGPIQYFLHIKKRHEFDTLQKLIQQKTLRSMFEHYPNVHKNQIRIIEELDAVSINQAVGEVAKRHVEFFKSVEVVSSEGYRERGSFADMAMIFIAGLQKEFEQIQMMQTFFNFLQEFVAATLGKEAWSQESPRDLLKYSNQVFAYFSSKQIKRKYRPFEEEDIKRLIYLLSKWMFINCWTNDRLFPSLPPPPDPDSSSDDLPSPQPPEQKTFPESIQN